MLKFSIKSLLTIAILQGQIIFPKTKDALNLSIYRSPPTLFYPCEGFILNNKGVEHAVHYGYKFCRYIFGRKTEYYILNMMQEMTPCMVDISKTTIDYAL